MNIQTYQPDAPLLEATRNDKIPRVQVARPKDVMVVLGRGSKADVELYLDICLQDGVPLYRRRGGGCAVVLDPGNLIVLISLHAPGIAGNLRYLQGLTGLLIETLEDLGVRGVEQAGVSDLVVADRKVGGSCMARAKDTLLYSASLLVDPSMERIERYLKHPPREPAYRNGRSHRDFLGRLPLDARGRCLNEVAARFEEEVIRRLKDFRLSRALP